MSRSVLLESLIALVLDTEITVRYIALKDFHRNNMGQLRIFSKEIQAFI